MSANIGQMFYVGEVPWHSEGVELTAPATLDEALEVGGLSWDVHEVELMTREGSPSPAPMRKALVRSDLPEGHPDRVVGVVHCGYHPVQNRAGAEAFDSVFGRGKPVYETGGYLGHGEKVWLMAKTDLAFDVGRGDTVLPYALYTNSHDATTCLVVKLTTIRVVCQNTLTAALDERNAGRVFRRGHSHPLNAYAGELKSLFAQFMGEVDRTASAYRFLSQKRCTTESFRNVVETLFPVPSLPDNPKLRPSWERRKDSTLEMRKQIARLRDEGRGTELDSAKGTCWGALNAITEYLDHHRTIKGSRLSYVLLGDGADIKAKALSILMQKAAAA